MRLAAGRAPGRKAIRCMAGGSYRMLSPDSGRRPRAAVELLGKLSFNVQGEGREPLCGEASLSTGMLGMFFPGVVIAPISQADVCKREDAKTEACAIKPRLQFL